MKKLLILLASFSFVAPTGMFVIESFSNNITSNLALAELPTNDSTDKYLQNAKILDADYKGIENVEKAGTLDGFQGQITFGYTDNQVDIIKTKIDGTVTNETFFTTNSDNKIHAIVGRGTSLVLFNANNVIVFDFSNQGENYIAKSANDTWFDSSNEGSINSFGTIKTYDEYLGTTNVDSSMVFVLPQRNKILNASYRNVGIFDISDDDGSASLSDDDVSTLQNISSSTLDLLSDYYSIFRSGSGSNTTYWMSGKNEETGKFQILNLAGGASSTPTFVSKETGKTISDDKSPMMTFDVGEKFGLALKTRVYTWSSDDDKTSHDDANAKFTFSDDLCLFDSETMGDGTDISYVTAAKDPNGNDALLIGTQKHQYIMRSKTKDLGTGDEDLSLDDFESIDTIGNTGTSVATQSYSTAMSNSYGKIYVLDGEGNVHMWQRKVDLSTLTSEDLKFADSDLTDSTTNLQKVEKLREKIEMGVFDAPTSTGQFVSLADVTGALQAQFNTSDLDSITDLTNFKNVSGELRQFTFDGSSVAWFSKDKVNFTVGTDQSYDELVKLIDNLEISDQLQFNAKVEQILEPIQTSLNASIEDLKEKHSGWENIGITVQSIDFNDAGQGKFLEVGTSKNMIHYEVKGLAMTNNEIKEAIFTNVTAIDLTLENTDMTVSETTNFEIGNLADVNAYDPENQVSASISQAMSVPTEDDTSDDKETKSGLAVKATDAATGTDITDIVDKYVSVSIEGTKLVVKYTDEKYETNIDLTVTLNTNGNAAANEFSSPITIHINWDHTEHHTNWALIGGIIGGVLGAALLGFLIFCFIKWWYPILATRVPGKRGNSKSYNRVPQQTADANSVRHARKHQIRKATTYSDKSIVRSGIFEREIDVNEEKFKNKNRKEQFLGYDLDEEAVVNNWSEVNDEHSEKRPRISYEKKSKVDSHNKEVAAKMEAKKRDLDKKNKK